VLPGRRVRAGDHEPADRPGRAYVLAFLVSRRRGRRLARREAAWFKPAVELAVMAG